MLKIEFYIDNTHVYCYYNTEVCNYVMVSKTVYSTKGFCVMSSLFLHNRADAFSVTQKVTFYPTKENRRGMAMRIVRVLNTNAVVTVDHEGRELIITGPGIGFKKKKGELLDQTLADKTYYLESEEDRKRLQQVVKEISEEYLEIADRVVSAARKEHLEVRDSLYITLTDHINSAVDRYRAKIALKNMMKIEIRKFYPKEYEIGQKAVAWIKAQNGEDLGDDEAAFIAMHIVSAELGNENQVDVNKITELINAILQIVRIHFKIEFNEKSISYERFLTHLKFFAARVFDNTVYQDSMQEIYKVLVEQNEYAYSGVRKIAVYIKKQYNYQLTIDEKLYLLIHIKRILDEQS